MLFMGNIYRSIVHYVVPTFPCDMILLGEALLTFLKPKFFYFSSIKKTKNALLLFRLVSSKRCHYCWSYFADLTFLGL